MPENKPINDLSDDKTDEPIINSYIHETHGIFTRLILFYHKSHIYQYM